MSKTIYRRYSEAFKRQVVGEYEQGASMNELKQRYGIGGAVTIQKWIQKYGREGFRHKTIVIQQPEEQEQVRALQEENRRLKQLVAELTLDKFMLERTVEVAEDKLGEEVKKTVPTPSSTGPKKSGV